MKNTWTYVKDIDRKKGEGLWSKNFGPHWIDILHVGKRYTVRISDEQGEVDHRYTSACSHLRIAKKSARDLAIMYAEDLLEEARRL